MVHYRYTEPQIVFALQQNEGGTSVAEICRKMGVAMASESRRKVFISHNSRDKSFVRKLAGDLREHGVGLWLDELEMSPGDSLMAKIASGIEDARYFVLIISPNSVESPWVDKELAAAFALEVERGEKFIIPAVLRDCKMPLLLKDKLYADFTESYEAGLLALLKGLVGRKRLRDVVFVPPGDFIFSEQRRRATVTRGFYIDTHCVTTGDFIRFLSESGYEHPWFDFRKPPGSVERLLPVNYVSAEDAEAYCAWRSQVEGNTVRLPTAEEWEKAARGEDGRRFPWGDTGALHTQYWFCNCREFVELENQGARERQPYDRFPRNASPYGVRDMAGNVLEWTSSDFHRPGAHPGRAGVGREVRGGALVLPLGNAACYAALPNLPGDRKEYIGFRCLSES